MTYIKPSEQSYKWKLLHLEEAVNEVLNDSSIKYTIRYSNDFDTEEEFKTVMHVHNGVDKNDTITYMDPSEWPTQLTWSAVKTKWDAKVAAQPLADLRGERNDLLAETDWMAIKAAETGVALANDWKTYRQALRDLPSHSNWPNLKSPGPDIDGDNDWPTPPS